MGRGVEHVAVGVGELPAPELPDEGHDGGVPALHRLALQEQRVPRGSAALRDREDRAEQRDDGVLIDQAGDAVQRQPRPRQIVEHLSDRHRVDGPLSRDRPLERLREGPSAEHDRQALGAHAHARDLAEDVPDPLALDLRVRPGDALDHAHERRAVEDDPPSHLAEHVVEPDLHHRPPALVADGPQPEARLNDGRLGRRRRAPRPAAPRVTPARPGRERTREDRDEQDPRDDKTLPPENSGHRFSRHRCPPFRGSRMYFRSHRARCPDRQEGVPLTRTTA